VAANTGVGALDRLTERSELLGVVAVRAEGCVGGRLGGEGLGKRVCWGGRVRMRRVVDRGCEVGRLARNPETWKFGVVVQLTRNGPLSEELDRRSTLSVLGGLP
jgi:hypothetical protein